MIQKIKWIKLCWRLTALSNSSALSFASRIRFFWRKVCLSRVSFSESTSSDSCSTFLPRQHKIRCYKLGKPHLQNSYSYHLRKLNFLLSAGRSELHNLMTSYSICLSQCGKWQVGEPQHSSRRDHGFKIRISVGQGKPFWWLHSFCSFCKIQSQEYELRTT